MLEKKLLEENIEEIVLPWVRERFLIWETKNMNHGRKIIK